MITIHQRYRQTDRRTTYHGNTALRYTSRGKNYKYETEIQLAESDADLVKADETLARNRGAVSHGRLLCYSADAVSYNPDESFQ